MSLRDAMRKAAGLLVQLPPESAGAAQDDAAGAPPAPGQGLPKDELDALLSNLERDKSGASGAPKAAGPARPAAAPVANAPKTVAQIARDTSGPSLDQIKIDAAHGAPSDASKVDLPAIYRAAKLPDAPFSAEQMLTMLASLPAELPLDTRRRTVQVTLDSLGKSMGATAETIVADASRKLAALAAYAEHLAKRTTDFSAEAEKEIAALQAQIEAKRKSVMDAKSKLAQLTQMCEAESQRLDDVLEFFSLDVAPSKYAPSAAPGTTPGTVPVASPTPPGAPQIGHNQK